MNYLVQNLELEQTAWKTSQSLDTSNTTTPHELNQSWLCHQNPSCLHLLGQDVRIWGPRRPHIWSTITMIYQNATSTKYCANQPPLTTNHHDIEMFWIFWKELRHDMTNLTAKSPWWTRQNITVICFTSQNGRWQKIQTKPPQPLPLAPPALPALLAARAAPAPRSPCETGDQNIEWPLFIYRS